MNDEYQLLANPCHFKKKEREDNNLDSQIFSLLNKKYPEYKIDENDFYSILKKIDFILFEATVCNIVEDTVEGIIQDVIDE